MLDAAVTLYRARFRRLMLVAALVVLPVQILSTIVLLSAQPDNFTVSFSGSTAPNYDTRSAAVQLGATVTVLIVNVISTAFVVAASTRIVADAYIDYTAPAGEDVRVARRRFFAVAGASLIFAVAQAIGVFACFVGLFVPLAMFSVTIPALVLEAIGVSAALGRSWHLAKSHFWRVLGLVVTAQVIGAVLNVGLAAAIGAFSNSDQVSTAAIIAQGLANAVAAMLTTPFVATATVVLYFDLRIREEAYDIQLLMQRNDARVAA
jgi:hypothetical protein